MKRIISIVLTIAICCGMFAVMATASGKFTDVPDGEWYADAVTWAVDNGITNGTGNNTFTPDGECTRGQIVTFLWRSFRQPYDPHYKDAEFKDVTIPDYFYHPVRWAVTFDITNGVGNNCFAPASSCTREQIVTFLWRSIGSPKASTKVNFTDVRESDYSYEAVQWAVENGVTNGMGENTFCPKDPCTRAQVVTFLYRARDIINAYGQRGVARWFDEKWNTTTIDECEHWACKAFDVIKEPTCTESGIGRYVCISCGKEISPDTIPALGHYWYFDDSLGYDYCLRCGLTWEEFQKSLPESTEPTDPTEPTEPTEPTGCKHNWVETNHPEEGHYEVRLTCDCGAVFQAIGESVNELWGVHVLEERSKATNATEVAAIVSQHCGSSSYEVWVVDRAAYTTAVCSICGATK